MPRSRRELVNSYIRTPGTNCLMGDACLGRWLLWWPQKRGEMSSKAGLNPEAQRTLPRLPPTAVHQVEPKRGATWCVQNVQVPPPPCGRRDKFAPRTDGYYLQTVSLWLETRNSLPLSAWEASKPGWVGEGRAVSRRGNGSARNDVSTQMRNCAWEG